MIKLAITIGGAVSLGSYEAGVMYELLRGLAEHNQNSPEAEKIKIDVLTGASAGGMTACIAAQKMMFEAEALSDPVGNAFFIPWVREISLAGLLALAADEPSDFSVLSSDLVEDISRRHLLDRYTVGAHHPTDAHSAADTTIYLGLAMSNLSGVDYNVPTSSGNPFIYTRFQDEFVRTIDNTTDRADFWDPIRSAAVACGAFPFAFRIQEVLRAKAEYSESAVLPPTNGRYAYTDGGVFQNEPLGLAKNLVDKANPDHVEDDHVRKFLFVAPNLRDSVMDQGKFLASNASMYHTAQRLVTVVFNQARFQDWVMVEKVNARIDLFDQQAQELAKQIKGGGVQIGALVPAADALLPLLYPNDTDEQKNKRMERLQKQFNVEYQGLVNGADTTAADQWLKVIAALERIGGVENYDPMMVYTITASDKELAGSCLFAFGGFFDEKYRMHDYLLGREKAREFLNGASPFGKDGPAKIQYNPKDKIEVPENCTEVTTSDLPRASRVALRDQIENRAHCLMKDVGVASSFVREAIDLGLLRSRLNEWLGL